ncbi:MAG: response regulator transcription factor [Dorea sp.]|nr:response regulator transcription factor [Dorea sp.]
MTIALIDDSSEDISLLYEYICRYCSEHKIHTSIKTFTSDTAFLSAAKDERYDLVFLDIFLQDTTGIQIAKTVKKLNPKCQIIFSTYSKEHAVKAFRLHALDYLLKPYTYAQLEDALNCYENTAAKFSHYIELKEGRLMTRILITDIMYVDYHNHYIQVHTPLRVVRSYMSFGDFSPMLSQYGQFLWCYRNCMVNMDYVDSWENNDFILKNGERLPIFKSQKKEIIQAYANYIFDYVNGGMML